MRIWTGFIRLMIGSLAGSCERHNEPSPYVKGGKFLYYQSDFGFSGRSLLCRIRRHAFHLFGFSELGLREYKKLGRTAAVIRGLNVVTQQLSNSLKSKEWNVTYQIIVHEQKSDITALSRVQQTSRHDRPVIERPCLYREQRYSSCIFCSGREMDSCVRPRPGSV